jgi:hypothetical protein
VTTGQLDRLGRVALLDNMSRLLRSYAWNLASGPEGRREAPETTKTYFGVSRNCWVFDVESGYTPSRLHRIRRRAQSARSKTLQTAQGPPTRRELRRTQDFRRLSSQWTP